MSEQFSFGEDTLKIAREQFEAAVRGPDGATCLCCFRHGKVYRRTLNSGMALWLITFYRHCKDKKPENGWVHITHFPKSVKKPREDGQTFARHCEYEKLAFWNLIVERPDGKEEGRSSGFWRLTTIGEHFVRNTYAVPSHIYTFDKRCLGVDGGLVFIRQALKKKFDYDELMSS